MDKTEVITERENYIDYAKAICLLFIMCIYIGFTILGRIILFAVPVLFAVTGYTFTLGKRTFKENVWIRFKALIIPFWIMMLVYALLEIVRGYLFGYGTASLIVPSVANALYGSGVIPFNGGIFDTIREIMSFKQQTFYGVDTVLPLTSNLWFLPAAFTGYVLFVLLVKPTKNNHYLKVLAVLLLLVVSVTETLVPKICQLPYGLGRGTMGAAFMLSAFWIRNYNLLKNKSKAYYIITNIFASFVFTSSLALCSYGNMLEISNYGPYGVLNIVATFVGGVSAIWLAISICRFIERSSKEKLKRFLSLIGRNAMTVYLWFMAVKFAFDAIYICAISNFNLYLLDENKIGLTFPNSFFYMIFEVASIVTLFVFICKLKEKSAQRRCIKQNKIQKTA